MKVMFLDESGDHNLTVIDPQYPLFALGGVIMDLEYAENTATERIREFKLEYFATENINLHTSDMARNRNGFEALKDRIFRARFYEGLSTLMNELEFEVVACVIKTGPFEKVWDGSGGSVHVELGHFGGKILHGS